MIRGRTSRVGSRLSLFANLTLGPLTTRTVELPRGCISDRSRCQELRGHHLFVRRPPDRNNSVRSWIVLGSSNLDTDMSRYSIATRNVRDRHSPMIVGSRWQTVVYPIVLMTAAVGSWTDDVGSDNARKSNTDEEDNTSSSQVSIRTISLTRLDHISII